MIRAAALWAMLAPPASGEVGLDAAGLLERCGGVRLTLEPAEPLSEDERDIVAGVLEARMDGAGLAGPMGRFMMNVEPAGDELVVRLPGLAGAEDAVGLLTRQGALGFHEVTGPVPEPGMALEAAALSRETVLDGRHLVDAQAIFDQAGRPAVSFRFDPPGARLFAEFTAAHVGEPFAVVFEGEVLTAPRIMSPITGGSGMITGSFTSDEAQEMAVVLRSGALPVPLTITRQEQVAPAGGDGMPDCAAAMAQ